MTMEESGPVGVSTEGSHDNWTGGEKGSCKTVAHKAQIMNHLSLQEKNCWPLDLHPLKSDAATVYVPIEKKTEWKHLTKSPYLSS